MRRLLNVLASRLWRLNRSAITARTTAKRAPIANRPAEFVLATLEERVLLSAAFDVTGLTALRADSAYSDVDGSGVAIAVLDTGIFASNPDLQANVVAYYNAVTTAVPSSIDASSVQNASDSVGHGTHVAGTAASTNDEIGVATAADIVAIKVLPDDNERQLGGDPLLRGLQFVAQYADQLNIKVVNMSLGEAGQNGGLNYNSETAADDISRAIDNLEAIGITVVSASGNSYANDPEPGASYPAVVSTISVASTWSDTGADHDFNYVSWGSAYDSFAAFESSAAADRFSATSQRSTLDNQVAAPGVDIYSTWNNSSEEDDGSDLLHNTLSGTSMASPFVAGVVALMQDAAYTYGGRYIENVNDVLQIIKDTADQIVDSNVSDNGRVAIVNGTPQSTEQNLPETGETFSRINVQRAIERVREIYSGSGNGSTPGGDTDATTATATTLPTINGTRSFSRTRNIGNDGFVEVGADDIDLFKLVIESPGALTIALSQPASGTAFDASLRIFDASGNQIYRADAAGGVYPSISTDAANPLAIGTYYVGVSSLSNVSYAIADGSGAVDGATRGDYTLTVSLSNPDPNGVAQGAADVDLTLPDVKTSATTVANRFNGVIGSDPPIGSSTTRTDVNDGDVDMFRVVAPDSGSILVQTQARGVYGPNAADTYVRVFDANFNEVAFNDDVSNNNTDSLVTVPVQIGQTYYVAVTNYANRTFDVRNPYGRVAGSTATEQFYDLYFTFDNGDTNGNAFTATRGTIGTAINAAVGVDGNTALSGANSGFKDVDFYAFTASAAGLLDLTAAGTGGTGFEPALGVWEFDDTGDTIVKVGDATGSSSNLVVQVSAGQTVYVSVTGRGNQNFNWFAEGSGTGGQTGTYALTPTLRAVGDLATLSNGSIQNNTPTELTLNNGAFADLGTDGSLVLTDGDLDVYKFVAPSSGSFDIRTDTTQEGSADTVLRLFDSAGNQIAVNDNASDRTASSAIRAALVVGQTYYIGVTGAGTQAASYNVNTGAGVVAGSTGTYGIAVTAATSPIASVADVTVSEPASGTATATFTVTLDFAPTAAVVLFYATGDGSATAGSDYTATSGTITFNPGETSKTITVPVLADANVEGNETFTLTLTPGSGDVTLLDNQATATIADLAPTILPLGGKTKATFTNADGRSVTVAIKGAGSGEVAVLPNGSARLTITGATTSTALSITGGDATLLGVTVDGSLKAISAKSADVLGDLSVSGSLGSLLLRNVSNADVNIGAGGSSAWTVGTLTDVSVTSASALKAMKLTAWLDTDDTPDAVNAPSIGTVTVKGDFSANLIAADVGRLTVSGAMSGADVRAQHVIGAVRLGAMHGSKLFAGVGDDVNALPTAAESIATGSAIKSVSVTGKTAGVFSDSYIAAETIGKLSLGQATTDNGGTPFGAAASESLASVSVITASQTMKLKALDDAADSTGDGDLVFRVL